MQNWIKKALLFLSGIALLSSCTNDEPATVTERDEAPKRISTEITIEEARADLEKLLSDIDTPDSRSGQSARTISSSYSVPLHEPTSRSEGSDSLMIHIFNFENNQGYAIMSGDIRVPSLLALAYSGSLPEDEEVEVPEGVAVFMEGLAGTSLPNDNETRPVKFKPFDPDENLNRGSGPAGGSPSYGNWENIIYKPNGFCPVKWDQDKPYNKYCPTSNGLTSLTGCVPTAVAQLMATYKHPSSYAGYTFNWDQMTEFPKYDQISAVAEDNIARLMQQLGLTKNLNVTYGIEASGADFPNIPRTLSAFNYSQSGSIGGYNTETIISELKNGYSVLASGYSHKQTKKFLGIPISTTYKNGHCWLIHGLLERKREIKYVGSGGAIIKTEHESNWYVLCNWGWGNNYNNYDGYYLSGAFDVFNDKAYNVDGTPSRSAEEEELNEGTSNYYQFRLQILTGIRK